MRSPSTLTLLAFIVSISLFAGACSGDAGSINVDPEASGVTGEVPGAQGEPQEGTQSTPCDVDGAQRCADEGAIEVCVDGVWTSGETCVDSACVDGACVAPCKASCEGKTCGDDGCGGVCGLCLDGESCDEAGQCVSSACVASCEGKLCGDDGCGGVCGVCAAGETCDEGACVACEASCENKVCGDDGCGGTCGACGEGESCFGGQCQSCAPSCEGKTCGDDGCGGSCGACGEGETCDAGACVEGSADACGGVTYEGCCDAGIVKYCEAGEIQEIDCSESPQGSCGWNLEGGFYDCGTDGGADPSGAYPYLCEGAGPCEPSCEGKVCGSDGCGGSCGTCDDGIQCIEGACVDTGCPAGQMLDCNETCIAMTWLGDGYCDEGLNCEAFSYDEGDCALPCAEGEVSDCAGGCIDAALLGNGTCDEALACPATQWDALDCEPVCDEGKIVNCELGCTLETWLGDDYCDTALNCAELGFDGGDCEEVVCEASCEGVVCGDDGCGGSCGTCAEGEACVEGACVEDACEPSCVGLACGDDGCGGVCGLCAEGEVCSEGTCEEAPCVPTCEDLSCGDDGCGGSCGTCAVGTECQSGACVEVPVVADATCAEIVACDEACGDDAACSEDCVASGSTQAVEAFSAWIACFESCDDGTCVVDTCAGAGSACFWEGTGDAACLDINTCMQACDDSACQDACLGDATADAKAIWLQLIWCANAVCGNAAPGADFDVCWGDALGQDGACASYGAACVADSDGDPVVPPADEPATTCAGLLSCTDACPAGDDACNSACLEGVASDIVDAYAAFESCVDACDSADCLEESCAGVTAACLWEETGDGTCADVDLCLGACAAGDQLCTDACFEATDFEGQQTWLQLIWCVQDECGGLEGEAYVDCYQGAAANGGECSDYVTACGLSQDDAVAPEPLLGPTCGEIASCSYACEAGDAECALACQQEAPQSAIDAFSAMDSCINGCESMDCVIESCADQGGLCYFPGEGNLTCTGINDCLGSCEGNPECVDACFAEGSNDAKAVWTQILWCTDSMCNELSGDAYDACRDEALAPGGACEAYVTSCFFDDEPGDEVPALDGLSCGAVYGCIAQCEAGDNACELACVASGSSGAQELFDAANSCFDACQESEELALCWADECTGVGAECFYETAGSASCGDVISCLGACANDLDYASCTQGCVLSGATTSQEQVLALEWCLAGTCGDLEGADAIEDCQGDALAEGGVCAPYASACLESDVP